MKWKVLLAVLVLVIGMGLAEARGVVNINTHVHEPSGGHGVKVAHTISWVEEKSNHHEHSYSNNTSYEYNQYNHSYNKSLQHRSEEEKGRKPVENLKNKFDMIRSHIENARNKYMSAKAKYEALKHRGLKDPETFRYAKTFIGNGIEVAKGWIEMLMIQIQHANMSEDQKNRLMVKLENCLNTLEVLEDKINSSETPEELKVNVQILKDNWSEIMITVKSTLGQLAVAKLGSLLDRLENVTVKVEGMISENNTVAINLLNDCKLRIKLARENLELANEKFVAMESAENPNKLWIEGMMLINDAKKQIILAFKDLKKIYIELRLVS
ncbi:hypothetical protein [Archaeoglobus sp.]